MERSSCNKCAGGYYIASTGAVSCSQCSAGTYSILGSTSCTQCSAGTYSSSGSPSCTPCLAGSYSNSGASSCIQCPSNTYASSHGSISCTNCDFGTFSNSGSSFCYAVCGDGMKAPVEGCDDHNLFNNDGCSNSCQVESGYACKQSSSTSSSVCYTVCGDGIRIGLEKCDDRNIQDGDGCSSLCITEPGYTCTPEITVFKDVCKKTSLVISAQEAAAATSTQATVGVGISFNTGASLISMSSPIGIFSMINQSQLLILLLVCGVYISDGVNNLILGMKITFIDFNFINTEKIIILKDIYSYLYFEQSNESLNNIEINSGSTFINLLKLFLTILLIILFHIVYLIIYWCCCKLKNKNKCRRTGEKLFNIFTFSIYIRIILQYYIIMLLSCFNEIHELKVNNSAKLTSFSLNIIIFIIILSIFGLCIMQVKKAHPKLKIRKQFYFIEFFNGLKNKTCSRMFPIVYMGQRILSCFLIIFLAYLNVIIKMSILTIIQSLNLLYLLAMRPFELVKDLILETF